VVLKEISNDPDRTMIVIDPRRTETADLADHHLQVRPGTDAWCLGAMLKILVDDELIDRGWLAEHSNGLDELIELLADVKVDAWCERAGLDVADVRTVAHAIGTADSVAVFEDLGIQMAPHSTLNSWLEKLLYVLTGNFAKLGGMNLHSRFGSLGGGGGGGKTRTSPVGDHRIIGGLIPCNAIPDEILTDHPDRFRAAIVESTNPVHSLADSQRMREAFEALDMVVVIDVAMTETARTADYVLPASSQYEKWEAAFFTLEFPDNDFHLRAPILEPLAGTLPEPEIHRRLVRALGAYSDDDIAELRDAAERGLEAFGEQFFATLTDKPHLNDYLPVVLLETLGPALGEGNEATSVIWGLAQTCAGFEPESVRRAGAEGDGVALGNALFEKIRSASTAVTFTTDPYESTWDRMASIDKRINLVVDELVDEFRSLADEPSADDDAFPFVLSAGERRSGTANTAIRDPEWRRKNPGTGLRISPADAADLGVDNGERLRLTTKRGAVDVSVEISDTLQPGHVSLPNGQGVSYPDAAEGTDLGVAANELTASEDRDWLAGTPWHKHVRARLELV
jgi:anaerobic selenocysteine-containing dehydrogenase